MSSTSRFLLEPAPPGLALVQDLVNTRPVPVYGVRDLLATLTDARRWAGDSVGRWREHAGVAGGPGVLGSADVVGLRRLRHDVEAFLDRRDEAPRAQVALVGGPGGIRVEPTGSGARWIAGAVWGALLLAGPDVARLKTCRHDGCPCAFYDRSRNNSRVWHDVKTCGNLENLRASRARRRTAG